MDQQTVILLGLLGFATATVIFIVISVVLASRGNADSAAANRKQGTPITNGFAVPALVTVLIIFVLALFLGIVPPLLLRG